MQHVQNQLKPNQRHSFYIHIPVEIEVGSMVHVVLLEDVKKTHVNVIGRWCEVIKINSDILEVEYRNKKFIVGLYAIELFIFGGLAIQNKEFDIKRVLKK